MRAFFKVFLLVYLWSFPIHSEEGMYPLSEIGNLDLQNKGFKIEAVEVYNPQGISLMDGIIKLSGCTASFVSADGLILTNHHCAFRAIQSVSTEANDFLRQGFLARTRDRELEAKSYTVRITESYRDVSREILAAVRPGMTYAQRTRAIDRRKKELVVENEKRNPGKRADVAEMFIGRTYVLFIYTYLKDVRLVYAPPRSVGEFGGEVDNWMWPRHTGDFSFMRAYVGPDGKSADYSAMNVPYRPKRFLRVNPRGVKAEDLVFLLGYPGRTYRHRSSRFLAFEESVRMPRIVKLYRWRINAMESMAESNRGLEIKLAPRMKGYANRMKNYRGKLRGMKQLGLTGLRRDEEAGLKKYIETDPVRKKTYGELFSKIDALYDEARAHADYEWTLESLVKSSDLLHAAFMAYEASIERRKKDTARKSEYMDRTFKRTKRRLALNLSNYHRPCDRLFFKNMVETALKLEGDRFSVVDGWIRRYVRGSVGGQPPIERFLQAVYSDTRLEDSAAALSLFDKSRAQLEKMDEPFLIMARSLYTAYKALEENRRRRKGILDELSSLLMTVRQKYLGTRFIPDANGTLRLTFGRVRGYQPADAVNYLPFTTLGGVVEKNTDRAPFAVPTALADLFKARDFGQFRHPDLDDIPVNLLYDADTTGGNSGSPILNARGELIGLNFDRTFEATINDFNWNHTYSRSIGVDIRYILWFTEKFGGAQHLLEEMGIKTVQ